MAFSLADYEILGEIGHGGFATVYRARQKSLNKIVAIKCLTTPRQQNSEQIARFRREAEATASLTNDNVITVFDYAFAGGAYYIVMEYVDGMTLHTAFGQGIPREGALCILEKTASALCAAHARNIIHRDVKPANILIGRSGQVKLADFGLAVFPGGIDKQDDAGSVLGTLNFLAPEALVSPREVDTRVDIFALGCMLYRVLAGTFPFEGATVGDVSHRILNESPAPLAEQSPLASITLRCLKKERNSRPSAQEVHLTLQEVIAARHNDCNRILLSFMSGTAPVRPEMHPTDAGKPVTRAIFPAKKAAAIAAAVTVLVSAALIILPLRNRDDRSPLPRIPGIEATGAPELSAAAGPATSRNQAAFNSPPPLTGTAFDADRAQITLSGVTPGDTILLDGVVSPAPAKGSSVTIGISPGRHQIDIRRKGRRLLSRAIDLLPYERTAIDLNNGRKPDDSATARQRP